MAKGQSRRRDTSRIANTPTHYFDRVLSRLDSVVRFNLSEIEDHRLFEPDGFVPDLDMLSSRTARIDVDRPQYINKNRATGNTSRPKNLFSNFGSKPIEVFSKPEFVVECIRRNRRKEVLHALRKTGKGSGRKKPRYTERSNIRC